jgi:hypothetical protein
LLQRKPREERLDLIERIGDRHEKLLTPEPS